jgi:hypothetical protein
MKQSIRKTLALFNCTTIKCVWMDMFLTENKGTMIAIDYSRNVFAVFLIVDQVPVPVYSNGEFKTLSELLDKIKEYL